MTRVASYYASVGIDFDVRTLSQVSGYLKRIERMLDGFRSRVQKSSNIGLKIRIDRASAAKTLDRDLKGLAKNMTITLSKFNVNGASLTRAINSAFSSSRGQIRVGTILSQSSLTGMRNQIRNALSNITINPRVNPRVAQGGARGYAAGGGGSGGGVVSGHHNPMMLGGGMGAIMRYGAYALPFVAGAYGLNSMGNMAQELQSNRVILGGVAQGSSSGKDGEYYGNFIGGLGDRLGMTTRSLTPAFTQMLAASRGTKLESSLEGNFSTFMEYSAGMGLNEEKQKRSLYAITQMIGKGKMGAEEVRQQLGDVMPTFLPMLAKAVTGGNSEEDIAKLDDMMKKGKVYTATYLPKVMEIMQQQANGLMPGYFGSINYKRGNANRMQERYAIEMMEGGGENAVAGFWETFGSIVERSIFSGKSMGKGLEAGSNILQGTMLIGPEFIDYLRGKEQEGNLFSVLFGSSAGNGQLQSIKEMVSAMADLGKAVIEWITPAVKLFGGFIAQYALPFAGKVGTGITNYIGSGLTAAAELYKGNITGENIGTALGVKQISNLVTSGKNAMFGGAYDSFKNATAPSSLPMPNNTDAAAKVANGTGLLDQYKSGGANVAVTNNITVTVDSAQSAEKMKQVIAESAKQTYTDAFKGQMSVVPKIPQ